MSKPVRFILFLLPMLVLSVLLADKTGNTEFLVYLGVGIFSSIITLVILLLMEP